MESCFEGFGTRGRSSWSVQQKQWISTRSKLNKYASKYINQRSSINNFILNIFSNILFTNLFKSLISENSSFTSITLLFIRHVGFSYYRTVNQNFINGALIYPKQFFLLFDFWGSRKHNSLSFCSLVSYLTY